MKTGGMEHQSSSHNLHSIYSRHCGGNALFWRPVGYLCTCKKGSHVLFRVIELEKKVGVQDSHVLESYGWMSSNPILHCGAVQCVVARTTTHCNKLLVALLCCNVLWFVCGVHMKRHTHNNYALVIIGYRKSGTCNISQEQHTVNLVLFAISHTLGVSFLKVYSKAEGEGMMDIAN